MNFTRTTLSLIAALFAFAAPDLSASAAPVESSDVLGIVTGPTTGTYIRIGEDIAKVARTAGVKVDVKESGGAIDNIRRVNSNENAALGIVQSDVLGFLRRSKNPQSVKVAEHLRMVFPLYKEEVHVLARKEIKSFADLKGKRVALGDQGSGSWLTAMNLFQMEGITPRKIERTAQPDAVLAVLKGDLDAMLFVGGKPLQLFKNLENIKAQAGPTGAEMLKRVHFVPLDDPHMLKEYDKAEITSADYAFVDHPVPTIAVSSLLVSYDFGERHDAYGQRRCHLLGDLTRAVREHLEQLRKDGHPKWKEVNLDANLIVWQRDACAERSSSTLEDSVSRPLEKELLDSVQGGDQSKP